LDGWEIVTTYKALSARTIKVEEKLAKTFPGDNDVLIVELERKPIFKPGPNHEIRDLHSTRSLFLELAEMDTIVTAKMPGISKLLRQIIAFSPRYGANKKLRYPRPLCTSAKRHCI